jgi:transcriptional regulator with XRE-family HTH domain
MRKMGAMKKQHPFYLRQWRKHRGLTQDRLAERLGTSKGYISDLERGVRRYNQDLLEALAEALSCEPADLLMRDPTQQDAMWSIWEVAKPAERQQLVAIATAIVGKKDGTNR